MLSRRDHLPLVKILRALLASTLIAGLTVSAAPSAPAAPNRLPPAKPWGACSFFTSEDKVVRTFSQGYTLKCGGPRFSSNPRWGYRHILDRHRDDFQRLTPPLLVNRNWRDLTDFVIEWTLRDPDHKRRAGGHHVCRDRVFWLADRNGRFVLKKRFKLYTSGKRINTVFPSGRGCA